MTKRTNSRAAASSCLRVFVAIGLFALLPGCSGLHGITANEQWLDSGSITNDPVKILLREKALVSGDFMQQLVTECAMADVRNSGFGDVTRTVNYDGINKTFSFTLDTKNSGWINSMCGIPVSLGQGLFSWLATMASGAKSFF